MKRLLPIVLFAAACSSPPAPPEPWTNVIPKPESVTTGDGVLLPCEGTTASTCAPVLAPVGVVFAAALRTATGWAVKQV